MGLKTGIVDCRSLDDDVTLLLLTSTRTREYRCHGGHLHAMDDGMVSSEGFGIPL